MTAVEIYMAQENIILQKYAECNARLENLSNDNVDEINILKIKRKTYFGCLHMGLLCATMKEGHAERALAAREKTVLSEAANHPAINGLLLKLDGEEKGRFISAVQGELYIRNRLYSAYVSEYEIAKASGDTEKASELSIQIEAIEDVLKSFGNWRKENGIYPHIFE